MVAKCSLLLCTCFVLVVIIAFDISIIYVSGVSNKMRGLTYLSRRVLSTQPIMTIMRGRTDGVHMLRCAEVVNFDDDSIERCGAVIASGGLVAFPTETVYGLGANALNATAVQSIFAAKKRPNSDPLIVHVLDKDGMIALFDFSGGSNGGSLARGICESLWDAFCPGPLTIIYKAAAHIPSLVTAGTGYVGVRSPSHSIALKLLQASRGLPIAAPSANRFGHVSPTSSDHVLDDLGDADVKIIRDDLHSTGGCRVGLESTVCRLRVLPEDNSSAELTILRCGAVTVSMIASALRSRGLVRITVKVDNERHLSAKAGPGATAVDAPVVSEDTVVVAPGQMMRHYAPDIPTFIVSTAADATMTIDSSSIDLSSAAVIDFGGRLGDLRDRVRRYVDLSPAGDLHEACFGLFRELRAAESPEVLSAGVSTVLLPDLRGMVTPPSSDAAVGAAADTQGLELALWERMHRAASGTFIRVRIQ